MKNLLLITLSFISFSLFSQEVHVGIEAGLNVVKSKIISDQDDYGRYFKNKPSFIFGMPIDINFSPFLNLHTGLYFSQLGTKAYGEDEFGSIGGDFYSYSESKRNGTINSILIPINYKVNFSAGSAIIFAGFGPEIQFNLSANYKGYDKNITKGVFGNTNTYVEYDEKVEMGTDLPRLAFGFNIFVGTQTKSGLFGKLFLTPGLTNIHTGDNYKEKQQQLGVSFGYMF